LDPVTLEPDGKAMVAVDTVQAGKGEIVLTVGGSSARQTKMTQNVPVDAAIIGVVDSIEVEGKTTFRKTGTIPEPER